MSHCYTSRDEARRDGMATGYRYWFGLPVAFDATYFPAMLPSGFLISTAEDMSHYLAMYLNGGSYYGRRLLSASGIAQMQHPAVQLGDSYFYGMGWIISKYGGVQAIWHDGTVPNFHTEMVLVPDGKWGIIVLENVDSLNPAVAPQIPLLAQNVTRLLAGNQRTTFSNIGTIYLVFDLALVMILAVQIWSLVRLLWRRSVVELPTRGLRHSLDQGRKWVLPLLWEVGGPVAIWFVVPVAAGAPWGLTLLYAPDLTIALWTVSGLWLMTALLRVIRAGLSMESRRKTELKVALLTTFPDPAPRR